MVAMGYKFPYIKFQIILVKPGEEAKLPKIPSNFSELMASVSGLFGSNTDDKKSGK